MHVETTMHNVQMEKNMRNKQETTAGENMNE